MNVNYLIKRFLFILFTLFIVSVIVFSITQLLPADAAQMVLGEFALPAETAALREKMGLNDPAIVQYGHWLAKVLQRDFGQSLVSGRDIGPMMLDALHNSLILAFSALVLVTFIAIPLGVIAGLNNGTKTDTAIGLFSYIGVSLPEFATATFMLIFFARPEMQFLPVSGYTPFREDFLEGIRHIIIPVLTLSLILIAHISRMVRSEMVDIMHTDYIKSMFLKGIPKWRIIYRHALPNALKPAIARAFAANPQLIICDEITSSLDVSTQATILKTLVELQEKFNTAYLFITHDLHLLAQIADRIGVFHHGECIEINDYKNIMNNPAQEYTKHLWQAIHSI